MVKIGAELPKLSPK